MKIELKRDGTTATIYLGSDFDGLSEFTDVVEKDADVKKAFGSLLGAIRCALTGASLAAENKRLKEARRE